MSKTDQVKNHLWAALQRECPLQIAGTINAYAAILAEHAGFGAIYLSGAGVANASRGQPDLGMITLDDVLTDARRITAATSLPLLVDADTGWGALDKLAHGVRELAAANVAGIHIEDQIHSKRCGHRPGKVLVSTGEMVDRISAAAEAKPYKSFVIMARTDAASVDGLDAAVQRARRYVEAGADMIFAEALPTLEDYRHITEAVSVPVLANATEFGKTPLFTVDQYRSVGIRMILYPLSAFRAMSKAAADMYCEIRRAGTQAGLITAMQTREELYVHLGYHVQEQKIDEIERKKEITDGNTDDK